MAETSSSKSPAASRSRNSSLSRKSAICASTMLRNLSARVRLSTAMMSVSPRALSARTRFDPMKPAAPVTTMYIEYDPSLLQFEVDAADLAHDVRDARRDGAQQFVADGQCGVGDVIDGQA